MAKKVSKPFTVKHDKAAKALALGQYQQRIVPSKKAYKRKPKHKSIKEI